MVLRQDGLVNDVTGLGNDELDLRQHTHRAYEGQRTVAEYEQEWLQNWMAHREVSQPASDTYREGFDLVGVEPDTIDVSGIMSWIEGDLTPMPDGSINRQLGILDYAEQLDETGFKVGGAALYPILDDGLDPSQPLDVRRIQRVVGWEVFDRSEIIPYPTPDGLEPQYYMLSDVYAAVNKGEKTTFSPGEVIHVSRLWLNRGVRLSRRAERVRQWWGASVLDLNWRQRRAVEEGDEYANTYLDRSSWLHYSMAGLQEMYRLRDDEGRLIGRELIRERMRDMRRMTRTLGVLVSDAGKPSQGESAETGQEIGGRNPDRVESVVEGTGDLIKIVDHNKSQWQAGVNMPRSIAFGEQSSALRGGENSGDWKSWQGTISARQKKATPLINWMLTIIFASREGPTRGVIPDGWRIEWRPLIIPSPKEKAEIAKLQAEADNERLKEGVAKAEEVRQQRLVMGDVEGDLQASDESVVSLPSADYRTAAAVLEGAIAVASGQISMPFFAGYLSSIDDQRFPPEKAEDLARKAALGRSTSGEDVGPDGTPKVSAASVLNAGSMVAQGKMEPGFMAEALTTLDPETFPADVAESLTSAATGGQAPVLPSPDPGPTAEPTADTEGDALEDDRGEEPEANPWDSVREVLPADATSVPALIDEIRANTGIEWSPRELYGFAQRHGIVRGRVGKHFAYSRQAIIDALARNNGKIEAPIEDPDESV